MYPHCRSGGWRWGHLPVCDIAMWRFCSWWFLHSTRILHVLTISPLLAWPHHKASDGQHKLKTQKGGSGVGSGFQHKPPAANDWRKKMGVKWTHKTSWMMQLRNKMRGGVEFWWYLSFCSDAAVPNHLKTCNEKSNLGVGWFEMHTGECMAFEPVCIILHTDKGELHSTLVAAFHLISACAIRHLKWWPSCVGISWRARKQP
jgi:hypothetical protein